MEDRTSDNGNDNRTSGVCRNRLHLNHAARKKVQHCLAHDSDSLRDPSSQDNWLTTDTVNSKKHSWIKNDICLCSATTTTIDPRSQEKKVPVKGQADAMQCSIQPMETRNEVYRGRALSPVC